MILCWEVPRKVIQACRWISVGSKASEKPGREKAGYHAYLRLISGGSVVVVVDVAMMMMMTTTTTMMMMVATTLVVIASMGA